MKTYFNYDDLGNSVLYLIAGLELIVISIVLALVSKRVADRILVLVGVGIGVLTYVWMLAVIPRFMPSTIRIWGPRAFPVSKRYFFLQTTVQTFRFSAWQFSWTW